MCVSKGSVLVLDYDYAVFLFRYTRCACMHDGGMLVRLFLLSLGQFSMFGVCVCVCYIGVSVHSCAMSHKPRLYPAFVGDGIQSNSISLPPSLPLFLSRTSPKVLGIRSFSVSAN